jgi:hypothetical protein
MTKNLMGKVAATALAGMFVAGSVVATTASAAEKVQCKGANACKGKGACKAGDAGCKKKNSCKGKGGCKMMTEAQCKKKGGTAEGGAAAGGEAAPAPAGDATK